VAKKLQDIPILTKQFWKKLGDETADRIRVHTTKGGKDVNNKTFKPYKTHSPFWFTKKVNGKAVKIYAQDYKTRKVNNDFLNQSSRSSKPDLQLTGDMMRNLQTRGFSKDNVIIGWRDENAQKIEWNKDMGRTVTSKSKPVTSKIERFILKEVDLAIARNAKEATSKPISFKIGK
jgi:hypothetical protein